MTSALMLPALPFPLDPVHVPFEVVGEDELRATSQAKTDIFAPPFPGAEPTLNAGTLFGAAPAGDFQFSARITVGFRSTFDAGVLMLWHDEEHWAKLCFEAAPDGSPTVVSVVNRIVSDDANAQIVKAEHVWMRISRVDGIFLFHSSFDGLRWDMVRLFALEPPVLCGSASKCSRRPAKAARSSSTRPPSRQRGWRVSATAPENSWRQELGL